MLSYEEEVPNVPCGVEMLTYYADRLAKFYLGVPNVPCGVEIHTGRSLRKGTS